MNLLNLIIDVFENLISVLYVSDKVPNDTCNCSKSVSILNKILFIFRISRSGFSKKKKKNVR